LMVDGIYLTMVKVNSTYLNFVVPLI
jgi:hypothetical protein